MKLDQLEKLAEVNEHPMMCVRRDDLKQLIALCRLQHEAMIAETDYSIGIETAIAAYDAFEKGEVK